MQDMSYEQFQADCLELLNKYLEKCENRFKKKKDYNYIAHSLMKYWVKEFYPAMTTLEILRHFTMSLKENQKDYQKLSQEEKYLIDFIIDNLQCVDTLTNSILAINYKIADKL